MLRNVAAIALDGVAPFELGVLCESFGVDRSDQGLPVLDFAVCGVEPGPVATSMGFAIHVENGLERLEEADLVAVPAMPRNGVYPEAAHDALALRRRTGGAVSLGEGGSGRPLR